MEPYPENPRPPFIVPPGLTNLAVGALLSSSDKSASPETLARIIDGDKQPNDDSNILLRKGTQWVQMDLGASYKLFAIVLWHAQNVTKVYYDVIVMASDDPAFGGEVRVLYNNDQDNTSNMGPGTDREYFETREGRLINAKGCTARYLRFYSKGSTESALNEYTEIEVYGRARKN